MEEKNRYIGLAALLMLLSFVVASISLEQSIRYERIIHHGFEGTPRVNFELREQLWLIVSVLSVISMFASPIIIAVIYSVKKKKRQNRPF